jgi:hypothetical protein
LRAHAGKGEKRERGKIGGKGGERSRRAQKGEREGGEEVDLDSLVDDVTARRLGYRRLSELGGGGSTRVEMKNGESTRRHREREEEMGPEDDWPTLRPSGLLLYARRVHHGCATRHRQGQ